MRPSPWAGWAMLSTWPTPLSFSPATRRGTSRRRRLLSTVALRQPGKDMARLEIPPEADMTPEQLAVCAEVVAGRRGKVPAPMIAWLRNPELARRGQAVGELLRFETGLEPHLSELAI